MLLLLAYLALGAIGHFAALVSVGQSLVEARTFGDFVRGVRVRFYALATASVGLYALHGDSMMLALATAYAVALCLVDYEDTYDNFFSTSDRR